MLSVQYRGKNTEDDALWDQIRTTLEQALEQKDDIPTARFTVALEISSLWMLENLSRGPMGVTPTLETRLEADILRQIVEQARRNRLI